MIERIIDSWRLFASGRPGLRFRERYRLHQSRKRGGFDFRRLLHVVGGVVLIVASAFFKQGLVKWLRATVPYVQTASAVLLVLEGTHIIYYWLSSGGGAALPG